MGREVIDDCPFVASRLGAFDPGPRVPPVRRVLYTTNVIESLHMQLRKVIKTRGPFLRDETATKLLCLALRNVMSKSVRSTANERAR